MSLYLYCLRESSRDGRDKAVTPSETCPVPRLARGESSGIKSPGVDGKGSVFARAFNGIAAVVSEVEATDFNAMQKKAQEDIQWIKEKALAHEAVVEEAMGLSHEAQDKSANDLIDRNAKEVGSHSLCGQKDGGTGCPALPTTDSGKGRATASSPCRLDLSPVIPVKFGVIFNNEERLAKVISEQGATIKAAFDRIRGKQEWSVKLFLKDDQKFKDQVKEQSSKLCQKSKEIAALPAGMAYFMEEEFNRELERECSRRLDEKAMKTFEELKPLAAEAVLVKILDSKLTGRNERMALNSAYLVAAHHLPEFENTVVKIREKLAWEGFLLEQSGPWPAYHFTEFVM